MVVRIDCVKLSHLAADDDAHRRRCSLLSGIRGRRPEPVQLVVRLGQRSLQVALLLRRCQGALQLPLRGRQVRHQPRLPSMEIWILLSLARVSNAARTASSSRDTGTGLLCTSLSTICAVSLESQFWRHTL